MCPDHGRLLPLAALVTLAGLAGAAHECAGQVVRGMKGPAGGRQWSGVRARGPSGTGRRLGRPLLRALAWLIPAMDSTSQLQCHANTAQYMVYHASGHAAAESTVSRFSLMFGPTGCSGDTACAASGCDHEILRRERFRPAADGGGKVAPGREGAAFCPALSVQPD